MKIDPGRITYGLVSLLRKLKVLKHGKKVRIREFTEENLEMESKDITIERVHRTGSKINRKKRAIIVKFLIIRTRMLSLANIDKNNSGRTIFTLIRIIVNVQQN